MGAARLWSTMVPLVKVKVFTRNLSMQCVRTRSIRAICNASLSLYAVNRLLALQLQKGVDTLKVESAHVGQQGGGSVTVLLNRRFELG